MQSDEDVDEYGEEFSDEEEEDTIFDKKSSKKGKAKKASIYADYDEFANILEQDLYSEEKAKKYMVGQKRGHKKRNAREGRKRQRTK